MSLLDERRPTAAPTTATTARLRDRVRASRGTLAVVVLVLLAALLLGLAQSRRTVGLLDPAATDPQGSHALATLLADQGVTVIRVTSATATADALRSSPDATLVVAPTAPPSRRMLDTVTSVPAAYVVLLSPDDATLARLAPWASTAGRVTSDGEVPAGCSWDVALRAGTVPTDGPRYATTRPGTRVCWGGAVLDAPGPDGTVTVVGLTAALTNAHLADSGNAALALGSLGRARTVVWWLPSATDPLQAEAGADVGIGDLVPSWVGWAVAQVAVAVLVAAWWRGRRLGRVVMEPLPVVVRATEAVEGRARLYRRGQARGRAAGTLRAASVSRLRARLSLPRSAPTEVVVAAVAARTGRPEPDVAALLATGPDPTDDAGLTALADALDALENEVLHP